MKLLAGTVQRIVGAAAAAGPATLVPESRGNPTEGSAALAKCVSDVCSQNVCVKERELHGLE